ncbi:MAG: CoA transferase [Alphaproteobacteria bacterium]|jgi:crotonobetainyl-CoA:carnitine CoA-transferase CaiB-like acyl-CoA transferase|nr:CoA transferase [Alphaproteobacteria bacterium]
MDYRPDAECPLDGVRVLDLSRLVAGNMSTHVLADHGADVIKVEPPGKGDPLRDWGADGISVQWKIYARNKRSIVMNLRDERGKALLLDMVEGAQVFVENFRTGGLEKMGLSPETLWARNPGLIILRVTGFGQTGPYANRPGFGTLIEGMSGFAMKTGFPDRPPTLPNMALADMVAGLYGAFAVMTALREVEQKGGKGQVIDLSLLEPLVSILGGDAALHHVTGKAPMRTGNRSLTASPRNTYQTSDGRWLAISGSMQAMAMRLFRAIGREDMCDDPRYATNAARVARADEVDKIVGDWVGARTLAENLSFFEKAEVTAGPVYDAGQLREDPHVLGREALVNMPEAEAPDGYMPMHNIIPRLSETPGAIRRPAPTLGQDTDALLAELGLGSDEVAQLRATAVVA